jgi:hypothetical protein
MRIKDELRLSQLPRLADWGRWAAAIYEAAGWGAKAFIEDWWGNVEVQQSAVLDSSLLAQAVILFVDECDEWQGSPTDLLDKLRTVAIYNLKADPKHDSRFPRTADWLWRRLREILPLLMANGIAVSRSPRGRTREITLKKIRKNGVVGDDADGAVVNKRSSGDSNNDTISILKSGVGNGDEANSMKDRPFDTDDTNDTSSSQSKEDDLLLQFRLGPAIWRNKNHNKPVTIIGDAGEGADGRRYVYTAESAGAILLDEIYYTPVEPKADEDLEVFEL